MKIGSLWRPGNPSPWSSEAVRLATIRITRFGATARHTWILTGEEEPVREDVTLIGRTTGRAIQWVVTMFLSMAIRATTAIRTELASLRPARRRASRRR